MTDPQIQNIEQKYNRIVAFFYCLLILFLPVSIALVEIMATFVVFFFLIKKISLNKERSRSGQKPRWVEYFVPDVAGGAEYFQKAVGIFIACVLISVIFSRYPSDSWIAFFGKVLEGYYLYAVFVDCIKTREHLRNCTASVIAASFLVSADGLFQFFSGRDFLRQLPIEHNRVSASLRHANDFGAYLIALIPAVFGLIILPIRRGAAFVKEWGKGHLGEDWTAKIVLGLTLLLMLVCLGLTFSRGSWIGFWFSMTVFVIAMRRYYVQALAVSLIFLAVFFPFLVKFRDVTFTTDNFRIVQEYGNIEKTPENLSKYTGRQRDNFMLAHSFQLGMGRSGFWEHAADAIKKSPYFGNGLNSYSKLATVYAHNCYLQMAAEIGIIGLLAFLAMIGVLLKYAWSALPTIASYQDKVLLASLLAGLAGFLVQSFFDTTLYSVQLGNLMWVLIGFIVVIPRIARSAE